MEALLSIFPAWLILVFFCLSLYSFFFWRKNKNFKVYFILTLSLWSIFFTYELNNLEPNLYSFVASPRNASPLAIRRAHKSLATRLHPDKLNGENLPFQNLQYAYETLMNEENRNAYNKHGSKGFSPNWYLKTHEEPLKDRNSEKPIASEDEFTMLFSIISEFSFFSIFFLLLSFIHINYSNLRVKIFLILFAYLVMVNLIQWGYGDNLLNKFTNFCKEFASTEFNKLTLSHAFSKYERGDLKILRDVQITDSLLEEFNLNAFYDHYANNLSNIIRNENNLEKIIENFFSFSFFSSIINYFALAFNKLFNNSITFYHFYPFQVSLKFVILSRLSMLTEYELVWFLQRFVFLLLLLVFASAMCSSSMSYNMSKNQVVLLLSLKGINTLSSNLKELEGALQESTQSSEQDISETPEEKLKNLKEKEEKMVNLLTKSIDSLKELENSHQLAYSSLKQLQEKESSGYLGFIGFLCFYGFLFFLGSQHNEESGEE